MPKLIHKLPKYSLHKASGQARVKYADRVIYLGKFGSPESHQRYAEFIARLPRAGEQAVAKFAEPLPRQSLLVGEIVLRYYEHAARYYVQDGKPTGEHVTIRCLLRPLARRFTDLPANDF